MATSRGTSLNGTSVLAAMLRERWARSAHGDPAQRRAGGLGRRDRSFRSLPRSARRNEAAWYRDWLAGDRDRWLIYVVRDFDTVAEYWQNVWARSHRLQRARTQAEADRTTIEAARLGQPLPKKAKTAADPAMV